jgi:hypothetical protein
MAVAPLRRRAGMIDIKNKERKIREELEARKEKNKESEAEQKISEEEHNKRLEMLKGLGLVE